MFDSEGNIPHALIISGGNADKRLEYATDTACRLLCDSDSKKPCFNCVPCRKVKNFNHPDVIYPEPEKGAKTISVDTVRKMRDDAYVIPNESDCKIYIVKDAELMTPYSQNALLKVLEEPPLYAYFFILVQSKTALLGTVLSRCTLCSLDSDDDFDDKINEEVFDICRKATEAVCKRNEAELMRAFAEFSDNPELFPAFLDYAELVFRDALVLASGGCDMIAKDGDSAKKLSDSFDSEQLLKMITAVRDSYSSMQKYANKNLTVTVLCSRLMQAAGR